MDYGLMIISLILGIPGVIAGRLAYVQEISKHTPFEPPKNRARWKR